MWSPSAWLLFGFLEFLPTEGNSDGRHLYDRLMHGYNPLVRPVESDSSPLNVSLGIKLTQLIDVVNRIDLLVFWSVCALSHSYIGFSKRSAIMQWHFWHIEDAAILEACKFAICHSTIFVPLGTTKTLSILIFATVLMWER